MVKNLKIFIFSQVFRKKNASKKINFSSEKLIVV